MKKPLFLKYMYGKVKIKKKEICVLLLQCVHGNDPMKTDYSHQRKLRKSHIHNKIL